MVVAKDCGQELKDDKHEAVTLYNNMIYPAMHSQWHPAVVFVYFNLGRWNIWLGWQTSIYQDSFGAARNANGVLGHVWMYEYAALTTNHDYIAGWKPCNLMQDKLMMTPLYVCGYYCGGGEVDGCVAVAGADRRLVMVQASWGRSRRQGAGPASGFNVATWKAKSCLLVESCLVISKSQRRGRRGIPKLTATSYQASTESAQLLRLELRSA